MRGDIALFLGLVAIVGGGIVVTVVLLLGGGDGDTNPCSASLVPLGTSDISQLGFQTEDAGLAQVASAAAAGDLPAAETAFFGEVHNFTHNVDPPLREVDEEMARELCEKVIRIEEELAFNRRVDVVASLAADIREILQDAAEALGYARPGG
jgi:hypothetical protein